jgi:hypothetical protein
MDVAVTVMPHLRAGALVVALCAGGCVSEPPVEPAVAAPSVAEAPAPFVSVPELKELMAVLVEHSAEAIWNAALDEGTPKTDDEWNALDRATVGLIVAGRYMMESHLAKDQGRWKAESQKMIDLVEACRKSIKERDLKTLLEAGDRLTDDSCTSCHAVYLNRVP